MEKNNVNECHPSQCQACKMDCSVMESLNSEDIKNFVVLKFKGHRTEVFLNYKNIKLFNGDYAIITSEIGLDAGKIIHTFDATEEITEKKYKYKINKTVVRKANERDLEKIYLNREEEKDVAEKATIISQSYGLEMKIIDVEWQFDKYKLTIFFTAPQRVDFRELVKDLARQFRTRIELRQMNTREEITRFSDSVGCCGRTICCNTFLTNHSKVTLEQVKLQVLSNTISKLNGNCMRLKCCMAFEYDFYETELAKYPVLYSTIIKEKVEYKLNKIDIFKKEVTIYNTGDKTYQTINSNDLERFLKGANIITPIVETREVVAEEDIIIDE